jgi:ferredoxin
MKETSRCIRCYACIENCPVCYCTDCSTKKSYRRDSSHPGMYRQRSSARFMFHAIQADEEMFGSSPLSRTLRPAATSASTAASARNSARMRGFCLLLIASFRF